MHYFFAFAAGSLLLATTAQAQAGLRLGSTLTHLAVAHAPARYLTADNSARLGYQVGVFYRVPLGKRLSLVPEVQFSRERVRLTTRDNAFVIPEYSGRTDSRLAMSYLAVPVLLRATFGPVYVEVGPQANVLLGGRELGTYTISILDGSPISSTDIDRPLPDNLRRFDLGPCVGVGVQLPAGLGLSVRAYQGLVSLMPGDDPAQPYPYQSGVRRQILQAALTYQLAAR